MKIDEYESGELVLCQLFVKNGMLEWCPGIIFEKNDRINVDDNLKEKLVYYYVYHDSRRYCLPNSHLKRVE
jgi:hypothetical protein